MQTVTRFKNILINVSTGIAGVVLFLMVLLIVVEVFLRWIFNTSTMVSTDFVAYGMVFTLYFGGLKALQDNVFVRIDVLYDFYKGKFKKAIDLGCDLILLFFNIFIMYYFFNMLQNTFARNLKALNIYETPLWIPRLIIFIGMATLIIYIICRTIEDLNAKPQRYSKKQIQAMDGLSPDVLAERKVV